MKYYQTTEYGSFMYNGMGIPNDPDNRHYAQMIEEVAAGVAEIIPYVEAPRTVEESRRIAYIAAGLTEDILTVALYEKLVEGRTDADTGIDTIQAQREAIKAQYPKV